MLIDENEALKRLGFNNMFSFRFAERKSSDLEEADLYLKMHLSS